MNVIPFLRYEDTQSAIDWIAAAFGFECTQVDTRENGSIAHAELQFQDGMVMLGPAGQDELGMRTPVSLAP
jgi:uncharacterized glyoxalase superfamily protein PhnB